MTVGEFDLRPDATYRRLVGVPGSRRLGGGGRMARLAAQMWQVAIVLFVLQHFHSPALAGLTVFLGLFPGLVVSPLAGALLDRHRRSRLISLDYALAFLIITVLVVLSATGRLTPPPLLPLAGVGSATNTLGAGGQP